ncbi:hypothetical protein [Streptomyces sp. NPDC101234]|uniref:hypothetical protein n=1 Tax=Streptomyces sp. NPDC101234 TaxID=3366138 RepID=UPI0037F9103D
MAPNIPGVTPTMSLRSPWATNGYLRRSSRLRTTASVKVLKWLSNHSDMCT